MDDTFNDGFERLRAVVDAVTNGTEWNQDGRVYGLRLQMAVEELLLEGVCDGAFCHRLAAVVEAALLCGKVHTGRLPRRSLADKLRRAA